MHDAPPCRERGGASAARPTGPALRWQSSYPISHLALTRRAGRVVRSDGTREAPPKPTTRMAETRVQRGPRLALQPRSNRSGGHNPMGRQVIDRPVPELGLQCPVCVRCDACEIGMVSMKPASAGAVPASGKMPRRPTEGKAVREIWKYSL